MCECQAIDVAFDERSRSEEGVALAGAFGRVERYYGDADVAQLDVLIFQCAFLAGALAMLLMFLLSSGRGARRAGFFSAIGLFLLALLCLDFAYWQYSDYRKTDSAIVMVPVSSVKSSPSSGVDAKDLFVLHEGTKVRILDEAGDWMNIELADGRQGWMRKSEVEMP